MAASVAQARRREQPPANPFAPALLLVSEKRPLGDTTTLADPAVVAELARRGKEEAATDEP